MEPRKLTKEQNDKLEKIKPGDVVFYHPYQTGNYNRYLDETKTQMFLVWDIHGGTEIMNLTGQIIQDDDPYGQAPDSLDIDQVIGKASEKEIKLANLCSEWRSINQRANLDMPVDTPDGTTWEQFKKTRNYV